jgi:hypothetical protein
MRLGRNSNGTHARTSKPLNSTSQHDLKSAHDLQRFIHGYNTSILKVYLSEMNAWAGTFMLRIPSPFSNPKWKGLSVILKFPVTFLIQSGKGLSGQNSGPAKINSAPPFGKKAPTAGSNKNSPAIQGTAVTVKNVGHKTIAIVAFMMKSTVTIIVRS